MRQVRTISTPRPWLYKALVSDLTGLSVLKHLFPSVIFFFSYTGKKGKETKFKRCLWDRVGKDQMSSKAKGQGRLASVRVTSYLSLLRTEELPGPQT